MADEWKRLLKPNGSLYVFASPANASGVEEQIRARFDVLNHIVWDKPGASLGRTNKEGMRSYAPTSERIVFAQHFGADGAAKGENGWDQACEELRGFVFEPLRAYLDDERKRAGIGKADCNVACGFSRSAGGMASRHYFSRSQWCLPTAEHYAALQRLFNDGQSRGELLRREYEFLRREYEDLRRPFYMSADKEWGDVWHFKKTPSSRVGQPKRHRMFLSGWRAELMFGEYEVLAAARHLVNGDTIFVEECAEVEYFHILFDQHEIVFAEGCPAESFHPGQQR